MADGDPVALIHDLSGNGNHAMQSVGAACPTWRTDGTLFWLEYDGVDDQLEIPAIAYGGPLTVCLGLQRYASGRWGAFRSPVTIPPYRYVGGSLSGASSTTVNTSGGFERVDGVPFVGSRDDLYEALLVPAVGVSLDNVDTALHAAGTFFAYGGLCPPGRVFGYLEVESMGASDINKAEHWMAGKIGEVIQ